MFVALRPYPVCAARRLHGVGLISIAIATALAGCSANITRLDPPSYAVGDGPTNSGLRRSSGGATSDVPAFAGNDGPSTAYAPPPLRPRGGVEVAGLPPIQEPTNSVPPSARALAVTRGSAPMPPASTPPPQPLAARGQQIEVQPGDTLFGLSRRHNVMISDLMSANDLKSPNLKPGQKLYLPVGAGSRTATPSIKPERALPGRNAAATSAPAAEGEAYTVKPGDSLYNIAARHKVKVTELQRLNAITDARTVKPGTVLRIPGGQAAALPSATLEPTAAPESPAKADPATPRLAASRVPVAAPLNPAPASPGLKVLNGDGTRHAAATDKKTMTDTPASPAATTTVAAAPVAASPAPAAASAAGKLRWPVKGRVVQGYGARADGTHNDGVDIAVPAGADVHAAEAGVVAYAGSEVKTYGNLVLLRHDSGLVTAYAYNDKLLVQRGDRVKRGQPIAKAGNSGAADQPQLHFEVRVGSKPVDPIGYLEKM